MGLNTTHNAWNGGYGSFHNWRTWLAEQYDIPLDLMQGFYLEDRNPFQLLEYKFPKGDEIEMSALRRIKKSFPLKWNAFRPNPLHELFYHSDCDGYINWRSCGKIAKELKKLLSELVADESNSFHIDRTKDFMEGCELAFKNKEKLEFH